MRFSVLIRQFVCRSQDLHQAGEKTWGTNESSFQRVLLTRSFAQLRATFQEYAKVANKDIEDTIKDEMGSDLKDGMLTIGKYCIKRGPALINKYF